jgi:hypothetical protein
MSAIARLDGAPGGASQGQSPARGAPDAVPRSGAALILVHGRIRQWSHVRGLPNALLEKPTVLQTAPLCSPRG